MDDTNQIEPPPSFVALYMSKDGSRLTQSPAFVVGRYELCEDLAHSLTERAATLLVHSDNERDVLERVREGLSGTDSPMTQGEAQWVIARLAELMAWGMDG
jgi:hypothetical protein